MEKHEGKTKRKWDVDITCLVCGEMIEKAGDIASEQLAPLTSAAQVCEDALEDDEMDSVIGDGKDSVIGDGKDSVIGDWDDD
jgi:hypothetical protein